MRQRQRLWCARVRSKPASIPTRSCSYCTTVQKYLARIKGCQQARFHVELRTDACVLSVEINRGGSGQRGCRQRSQIQGLGHRLPCAAEQGCLYSAIVNDLHRAAGRSGVGTVMASKQLKAVVVRGTKGVSGVRDAKAFFKATSEGKRTLAENAVTGEGLPKMGTQVLMNVINEVGAMPTRNMREVQFEGVSKISAEAMHEPRESDGKPNLVTNGACFGCTIACGRISRRVLPSHFGVPGPTPHSPRRRGRGRAPEARKASAPTKKTHKPS